jgi:ferredoxin
MAYVINEPCLGLKDASCIEVCPVDAITPEDQVPAEWQRFVEINAGLLPQAGHVRKPRDAQLKGCAYRRHPFAQLRR